MVDLLFSSPIGQWFLVAYALFILSFAVVLARNAKPGRGTLTFLVVVAVGIVFAVPSGVAFMMIAFVAMGILSGGNFL